MKLQDLRQQVNQARSRLTEMDESNASRAEIEIQIELLEKLQAALRKMRSNELEFHQTVAVTVYSPPRKPRSASRKRTA